jgi:lysophospholipase L1-like esterase
VSPITLNLWGNDLSVFIRTCGFPNATDFACIQAGAPVAISQFASRLSDILRELREAAPDSEIIITGAYNVFIGAFPLTDPMFQSLTNAMAAVAAEERAVFANEFPVFNPQGNIAAETAAICTLTLLCTQGDSHPSDAGYQAIGSIVFDVSGYSRLLE